MDLLIWSQALFQCANEPLTRIYPFRGLILLLNFPPRFEFWRHLYHHSQLQLMSKFQNEPAISQCSKLYYARSSREKCKLHFWQLRLVKIWVKNRDYVNYICQISHFLDILGHSWDNVAWCSKVSRNVQEYQGMSRNFQCRKVTNLNLRSLTSWSTVKLLNSCSIACNCW